MESNIEMIEPGEFEDQAHYYEKVRNASIHPMVKFFLTLSNTQIIERYCHLHPEVDKDAITSLLSYSPKFFKWAGADLFPVVNEKGVRNMVLIETNSCPSGSKSMPLYEDAEERGSYIRLVQESFLPAIDGLELPEGVLAVIYDKNKMEASGYAHALADVFLEKVYLVQFHEINTDRDLRFEDGILYIHDQDNWIPVRAAFKYVTQKPWNRIPLATQTYIYNPIVCCLAGGRNKLVAAKAYDFLNGDLRGTGLEIRTPETVLDVSKNEIPYWIQRFGGFAVIKVPYSNAGQGVYTITSQKELDRFMELEFDYDIFIIQSLIGNASWSSIGKYGRLYHIGTVPTRKQQFYVADIRMMIISTPQGYRPVTTYARRSRIPLSNSLETGYSSWDMLGTNLSLKNPDGSWGTDTDRLLLMDGRDFNRLGIGIDDLIEGFIQTVLAAISIDKMSNMISNENGDLKRDLFHSLDPDDSLLDEIIEV
ncbi:MAG: hypothetical protein ACXAE3_02195 [Candidatus Kariarchaeaceae archaeon]